MANDCDHQLLVCLKNKFFVFDNELKELVPSYDLSLDVRQHLENFVGYLEQFVELEK